MRKRTVTSLCTLTLTAFAVAGCGGGAEREPQAPPIGSITTVTDPAQILRPIDRYIPTGWESQLVNQAANDAMAECMRSFGITFTPAQVIGLENAEHIRRTIDEVFGAFDPQQVWMDGYRVRAELSGPAGPMPEQPGLSPAEAGVFNGVDPVTQSKVAQFAGRPVPDGGCFKVGRDSIGGISVSPNVGVLPFGGPKVPADDPRIKAAVDAWRGCMREHGYEYPDPSAAYLDDKWHTAEITSEQRATAAADNGCKVSTNLVGVVLAVTIAYDNLYIERNAVALSDYRKRVDEVLRQAKPAV
ncbi:hypothetical protein [Yinghuangia soli]|uniref:PknH-like extracellular domain-containing protein n=1 Tax=Yinghuangia soli TaxID=2908204 RepID=A0AA41U3C5_9ACTN|nr:hypothetical protein [Yinghuangia soli]MCF2529547.1 hypothetical protein [Yinghuangia soli]